MLIFLVQDLGPSPTCPAFAVVGKVDRVGSMPLVLPITTPANEWEGGVEAGNRIM
jgi:hypothetical protein